ncbi:hypothetical protein GCM10025795_45080 [Verticiella sediminum]
MGLKYDEAHLFAIVDALDDIARESGRTIPQVALNWLLQRPTVSNVIIGAVGWSLTSEQVSRLDAASDSQPPYPTWHQRSSPELKAFR